MKNPYLYWLLFLAFTHVFLANVDALPEFLAILLTLPIGMGGFVLLLMAYEWLNHRYGDSEQLLVYGLLLIPAAAWWVI